MVTLRSTSANRRCSCLVDLLTRSFSAISWSSMLVLFFLFFSFSNLGFVLNLCFPYHSFKFFGFSFLGISNITRRKETQKYLMESCYHRIKCIAATFLAAFMWRRPLNSSTVLATTTHRKPKRVSDGTNIQVRAQMINKCRIKMI